MMRVWHWIVWSRFQNTFRLVWNKIEASSQMLKLLVKILESQQYRVGIQPWQRLNKAHYGLTGLSLSPVSNIIYLIVFLNDIVSQIVLFMIVKRLIVTWVKNSEKTVTKINRSCERYKRQMLLSTLTDLKTHELYDYKQVSNHSEPHSSHWK